MADLPLPGRAEDDEADGDDDGPVDGDVWLARLGEVPVPTRRSRRWVSASPLLAGAVVALVSGVAVGVQGVVGALAGAVVVVLFFASGALPFTLTAALGESARLGLPLLGLNYVFRVGAALLVPLALVSAGAADRRAVGVAVLVCSLVRVHTQVVLLARTERSSPTR